MRMGYRTVSLSYQELYDLARKVAVFLEKEGVKKGDKVLLLAPNSPYWIAVFWGTLLRGAVLVPLNTQSTPEMIRRIAEQTEARLMFKSLYINKSEDTYPSLQMYDIELIKDTVKNLKPSAFEPVAVKEDDLAEILYTSGTTGEPKGVMLTHKNLTSNAEAVSELITLSDQDKFLSILPLSHIFEQVAGFLIPFKKGCTIVYAHSPAAIGDLMQSHKITLMAAVPEFLKLLMGKIESKAKEKHKLKTFKKIISLSNKIRLKPVQRLLFRSVHKAFGGKLRAVASGGAPLDPILEQKWSALGVYVLQGYGLTETSPVLSNNDFRSHRVGSVGKVLPTVKLKIARDGEILAKGPSVFQGYYKNDEKTRAAFTRDGWFKTGDLGEIDLDGFLYIKGRKKYMILGPGGQNVYPEDIESELNHLPGIKDSCVVGLEKERGMVEIHAVLLAVKNPAKIIDTANKKLASYQQISGWSRWPEEDFPRSVTRKVKKEEVLKWLRSKKEKKMPEKAHKAVSPLIHLLAEITGTDLSKITRYSTMANLNLDSLLRVELVARVQEKYGVILDEPKIVHATTVRDLEKMIEKTPKAKQWPFSDRPLSWWAVLLRFLFQEILFFPISRLFMRLKVNGSHHLKDLPLPALFMPNHLSYLDHVAVARAMPYKIRRKVAFAAAVDVLYEQYKSIAWLAEPLFNSFRFPRKETESIQFGLEYAGRRLDQGYSVVVYPEGKMSLDGKLLPLKRGAGLLATEMDVYTVPVKIEGTSRIIPYAKHFPRRFGTVTVTFGKPLKFKRTDSTIETTEKIQNIMKSM